MTRREYKRVQRAHDLLTASRLIARAVTENLYRGGPDAQMAPAVVEVLLARASRDLVRALDAHERAAEGLS